MVVRGLLAIRFLADQGHPLRMGSGLKARVNPDLEGGLKLGEQGTGNLASGRDHHRCMAVGLPQPPGSVTHVKPVNGRVCLSGSVLLQK